MPYYRIIIYIKDKIPLTGIRHYESANIEKIFRQCQLKAKKIYKGTFLDIEVQMLSKVSTVVKNHLTAQQKKRDDKNLPESNSPE